MGSTCVILLEIYSGVITPNIDKSVYIRLSYCKNRKCASKKTQYRSNYAELFSVPRSSSRYFHQRYTVSTSITSLSHCYLCVSGLRRAGRNPDVKSLKIYGRLCSMFANAIAMRRQQTIYHACLPFAKISVP